MALVYGWELDNMGKWSNHIVFLCETFIRVYINNTLMKNFKKIFKNHPSL